MLMSEDECRRFLVMKPQAMASPQKPWRRPPGQASCVRRAALAAAPTTATDPACRCAMSPGKRQMCIVAPRGAGRGSRGIMMPITRAGGEEDDSEDDAGGGPMSFVPLRQHAAAVKASARWRRVRVSGRRQSYLRKRHLIS